VRKLIKKLDKRKASGPDGISAYLLKEYSDNVPSFIPALTAIFQASMKSRTLPKDWKMANICPVYKSGSRSSPSNYRPISLTSLPSKLLERIIASHMWEHIDANNLLTPNQHGFRKGLSTTTQLLHVLHTAGKALDKGDKFHLVSFDFAKAFDKVPHGLLIYKLSRYGFGRRIVGWIEEWLQGRKSVVTVNGLRSAEFKVASGVPQGSVLGPLLFLLYINDMPQCITHGECRLYADDTLLGMVVEKDRQDILQQNVSALSKWSDTWNMQFNPTKCEHMQINHKGNLPSFDLILNNIKIPKTNSIKYLGVNIHSTLRWSHHITKVCGKANKTLGIIRRCFHDASAKTSMAAFNSVVRPVMEYACQVWSPDTNCLKEELEKIHRRAIRWAFKIPKRDSVTNIMTSHNILSLSVRRDKLDLKFLEKIQVGDYFIKLKEYITFNDTYNTRGNTINPHFKTNRFKHSYYNRMRPKVKVTF
jgi:hypothetical protein